MERMFCTSVCSQGGLQDDVRKAAREKINNGRNIEFGEEAFRW
jgi:hypothetical protein